MFSRSPNLSGQLMVASRDLKPVFSNWSAGGTMTSGVVARNVVSCARVNRLAATRSCPAGVNEPACVLLYVLIAVARSLAESAFNDPARTNGNRFAGVPSPTKSVRKISPGVACGFPEGTNREAMLGAGLAYLPMKESFGPQTEFRLQPAENWCLRSKGDGTL